ncbi:hypothetical protein [Streptomyces sp. NPDC057413]|uniref:hypothetical protein n=1 Tax=Streptomyces sp. NPDC057413 TaxID=3346124 RepID=UPI0036867A40
MGNRADEYGTDVEIYRRWLNPTIYVETPTGAPAKLLDQLDQLGFERHQFPTPEPVYIWHEVPAHLDSAEQLRMATRAIPTLLLAGYQVNCTPEVFDEAAYQQAVHAIRSGTSRPHPKPQPLGEAVTPRTPPPMSRRLSPRLATAVFRRYLRACIPAGPDRTCLLAGARPEAALSEARRTTHP